MYQVLITSAAMISDDILPSGYPYAWPSSSKLSLDEFLTKARAFISRFSLALRCILTPVQAIDGPGRWNEACESQCRALSSES